MSSRSRVEVLVGDCRAVMARMEPNSIDAIVCDPPYGISFMGKGWDHGVPGVPFWVEAIRVLKPGGYLLAFGGTRMFHRMAVAIEDAGFEIRDCLMYLYGSGFPKSMDPSKKDDRIPQGLGTALKPAWEPIVMARKPFKNTVAANVLEHGTGALNIDATRIAANGENLGGGAETKTSSDQKGNEGWTRPWMDDPEAQEAHAARVRANVVKAEAKGRWPANVLLSHHEDCVLVGDAWSCNEYCPVRQLDEQTGTLTSGKPAGGEGPHKAKKSVGKGGGPALEGSADGSLRTEGVEYHLYGDSGGASRFFYSSKVSKKERNAGLEGVEPYFDAKGTTDGPMAGRGQPGLKCKVCGHWKVSGSPCTCDEPDWEQSAFERPAVVNDHPTVKPVEVMAWLVRMVTPPGGVVLDPFLGSGSTGIAAIKEGFDFVGAEMDQHYATDIAYHRLAHAGAEVTIASLWTPPGVQEGAIVEPEGVTYEVGDITVTEVSLFEPEVGDTVVRTNQSDPEDNGTYVVTHVSTPEPEPVLVPAFPRNFD